ncbi:hypothetical protein GCM10029964_055880 [Kibdelosporangium lantanae]
MLDAAVDLDEEVLVAALPNTLLLRTQARNGLLTPWLRDLVPAELASGATAPTSLREQLHGLGVAERHQVVVELVRATAAAVLGHTGTDAVPDGRAFKELGFDSLTAVEFRNRLATHTGLRLPTTLVFDHPTPVDLGRHLADRLGGDRSVSGELAAIETFLAEPHPAEVTDQVADRLRAMLAGLDRARVSRPAAADNLAGISDDELFEVLRAELRDGGGYLEEGDRTQ